MTLYPFILYPHQYSTGHTESPRLASNLWLRIRKTDPDLEDRPWYAVGVEVDEETLVLRIYHMRDNFCGGPGHLDFTVLVKRSDLTVDERLLLLQAEQEEALGLAEQEIERQNQEAYKRRRQTLASSMFPHLFNAQTKEQQP